MAAARCVFSYRKPGKSGLFCKALTESAGDKDYCGFQYFCKASGLWENSDGARDCKHRILNDTVARSG